jgi:hypothetical protein
VAQPGSSGEGLQCVHAEELQAIHDSLSFAAAAAPPGDVLLVMVAILVACVALISLPFVFFLLSLLHPLHPHLFPNPNLHVFLILIGFFVIGKLCEERLKRRCPTSFGSRRRRRHASIGSGRLRKVFVFFLPL